MVSKGPLVTVITVTYNSALYVADAIESVLGQSYINIEYIIADDCSTDDTWNIVQQFNDPRIIAFRNDGNLGEYPNRNKAIEKAKGEYLIFIDGDDLIYSHGIGFFVDMMEKFPEAALAVQKNYYNNIIYPVLLSPRDSVLNYFFGKTSFLTSSFASNFFRTRMLKEGNGLSTRYKSGDEEVRLRLASQYPILLVAGWVSWPRETPGQASSKIQDGLGLVELYCIVQELLGKGNLKKMGSGMGELIRQKVRAGVITTLKKKLLAGNFKRAGELKKLAGMKWPDLIKKDEPDNYPTDFLSASTPGNPYKQTGFLHARSKMQQSGGVDE
ncbi:glycosyltransferase family 2 protein [Flavitalea flava]